MLKFWVLVFNYKSPNQGVFAVFMALFVILLNFIGENFQIFPQHIVPSGIRILNRKKAGCVKAVFSIFFTIYFFYRCQKTGLIGFPGKRASTKIQYLLDLPNCTEFHQRNLEFHCQFCFLFFVLMLT